MTITINTRLHDGIYKSSGGGETRIVAEYPTEPKRLLQAIIEIDRRRRSNIRSYGNIGCGSTWLEIDGVRIPEFEVDAVSTSDVELHGHNYTHYKTRTDKCAELISEIQSGEFQRRLQDMADQDALIARHRWEFIAAGANGEPKPAYPAGACLSAQFELDDAYRGY